MSSKVKSEVKNFSKITYYSICGILMVVCLIYAGIFYSRGNNDQAILFLLSIGGIFLSFFFNYRKQFLISSSLALFLCNALIFYSLVYFGYHQHSQMYLVVLVAASFLLFDTYHIPIINLFVLIIGHIYCYNYYSKNGPINPEIRLYIGEYLNYILSLIAAAYMSFQLFHNQKYHKRQKQSLSEKIREKNLQLTKKNEQLENIIYITSHDLQEPLRNILNMTDIVSRSAAGQKGEIKEGIKYLNLSTQKMSQIITGLMTYAQIGNQSEKEWVDINVLIADLKADLADQIDQQNATLDTYNLPTIVAYRNELFVLFQNLISNAIQFRHPDRKPHIEISAEKGKTHYTFWVKDNGIGMDEKFAPKAFDLLKKSSNGKGYQGLGIGLAHCKKIVELHEGNIDVSLNDTFGTTFYFTIKQLAKK